MSWEVRTMRSATSSCKGAKLHMAFHPALFRKNMTRFWPIWALYGVIWLLALPATLLTNYTDPDATFLILDSVISHPALFARAFVPQLAAALSPWLSLFFGIAAAMAVFSYLFQSRSCDLIHALPLRREGLFLTNYLSGLAFFALPLLAVFFLSLIAECALGALYFPGLFSWLCVNLLTALFFYSFAVLCAMLTGHILAMPAFYFIFNGLVFVVVGLLNRVLRSFVYGYAGVDRIDTLTLWCTPILKLHCSLSASEVVGPDGIGALCVNGFLSVFTYALAGLAFAGLALALYRRRQLECAGDVVSLSWLRPIFQYGVAFCVALSLGMFLDVIFSAQGPWALLGFMLVSGAIGYFAAAMFLRKTFRVFNRGWLGLGIFSLVLCAGMCAMVFDLTGFERRVPDPAQVAEITLSGVNTAPYDGAAGTNITLTNPDAIAAFTRFHTALVAPEGQTGEELGGFASRADEDWPIEEANTLRIDIQYTMADGSRTLRNYIFTVSAAALHDSSSAAAQLQTLLNRPEVVEQSYFGRLSWYSDLRLTDVILTVLDDSGSSGGESLDLTASQRQALLEAIQADMAEGNLGRRYLLNDQARYENCYFNDLELWFTGTAGQNTGRPASEDQLSIVVTLQITAAHTLALLEEYGISADTLITSGTYYSG